MRLMIKQRVFAWTDTYDIYDEYGNPKYFVKTEFFNIGHHMHIYDMYDQEVGVIHQEIFHLLPVFEVEIGGRTIGRIQRRFSLFTPRYDIEWQLLQRTYRQGIVPLGRYLCDRHCESRG